MAEQRYLLRTDHAPLVWLLNFKNLEGILARWLIALSSCMPFDCIQHRAGHLHGNADALSHVPIDPEKKTKLCPGTYRGWPSCHPEDSQNVAVD